MSDLPYIFGYGDLTFLSAGQREQYLHYQTYRLNSRPLSLTCQLERLFPIWKMVYYGSPSESKTQDDGLDRRRLISSRRICRRCICQSLLAPMFFRTVLHHLMISQFSKLDIDASMIYLSRFLQSHVRSTYADRSLPRGFRRQIGRSFSRD